MARFDYPITVKGLIYDDPAAADHNTALVAEACKEAAAQTYIVRETPDVGKMLVQEDGDWHDIVKCEECGWEKRIHANNSILSNFFNHACRVVSGGE